MAEEEVQCPEWYQKLERDQQLWAFHRAIMKTLLPMELTDDERHLLRWVSQESIKAINAREVFLDALVEIDEDALAQTRESGYPR